MTDTAATTLSMQTITAPIESITGAWEAISAAAATRSAAHPFADLEERSAWMEAYVSALAAFGATCFALAGFMQAAAML